MMRQTLISAFWQTMCDKGVYNMGHYLSNVKSPQIRSIIAKYRLDVNNTLDSKYTSFRCKIITSNLCRFCNVRQCQTYTVGM